MKREKIGLICEGRKIIIPEVKKVSELGKIRGLMFRRKEKSPILLFKFKNSVRIKIHSFFVFFEFIAVWLDDKNKVIEIKKISPWRISIKSKKPYSALLEIPISYKNKKIIGFLCSKPSLLFS